MAISQLGIQNRALRLATMEGADPTQSPVIDNGVVLEDLFPIALRSAIIQAAQKGITLGQVRRSHTLSVTSGVATLPDTVIDECLDTSTLSSTTDATITQLSSWQPQYLDFVRPVHSQLHYYTTQGADFLFREAGADYGDYTGTLSLNAVSMPATVGSLTADLGISTDIAETTIEILAARLRGG